MCKSDAAWLHRSSTGAIKQCVVGVLTCANPLAFCYRMAMVAGLLTRSLLKSVEVYGSSDVYVRDVVYW